MSAIKINTIPHTPPDPRHPYMSGAWTPNFDEYDADKMEVIGEIPNDIDGVYVRNTENPVHGSIGLYHPFDGDGMIHAISFRDGQAAYHNRLVRTKAFAAEADAGKALWAGIAENPCLSTRRAGVRMARSMTVPQPMSWSMPARSVDLLPMP